MDISHVTDRSTRHVEARKRRVPVAPGAALSMKAPVLPLVPWGWLHPAPGTARQGCRGGPACFDFLGPNPRVTTASAEGTAPHKLRYTQHMRSVAQEPHCVSPHWAFAVPLPT